MGSQQGQTEPGPGDCRAHLGWAAGGQPESQTDLKRTQGMQRQQDQAPAIQAYSTISNTPQCFDDALEGLFFIFMEKDIK